VPTDLRVTSRIQLTAALLFVGTMDTVPEATTAAVLSKSESLPDDTPIVQGYGFEDDVTDYDALFASYAKTGFQATNFGKAIDIVNDMVSCLLNNMNNRLSGCSFLRDMGKSSICTDL